MIIFDNSNLLEEQNFDVIDFIKNNNIDIIFVVETYLTKPIIPNSSDNPIVLIYKERNSSVEIYIIDKNFGKRLYKKVYMGEIKTHQTFDEYNLFINRFCEKFRNIIRDFEKLDCNEVCLLKRLKDIETRFKKEFIDN